MKRNGTITTILLSVLAFAGTLALADAQELDGRAVLKNMLEAEAGTAFIAHEVTTLARGPAVTSEQIVYRAGFKGMRMEYLEPPTLKGEIRADDGRVLAHLIPKEKVLRIRPSRIAALKAWTGHIAHAFERGNLIVNLIGRDKIAGRSAYVLEVKPKLRHKGPTRKLWIDAEKWIKLKTEDIAPGGAVVSMSYYTKIDFVNTIPDEKFRIEPGPGVRVEREPMPLSWIPIEKARQQAGFRILEPEYLPPGFKLAGATVVPFRGGKLVGLRYTDGVSTLSLFQTPGRILSPRFLERLHEGPVQPREGIYSWRQGQINLTIVGRIPTDEIRRVAGSVK